MCSENKNKVIIVCDNHHNGLNLARSFGVNRLKPIGIIICPNIEECYIHLSKYWGKTYIVNDYGKVLDLLFQNYSEEEYKPVIFTCSDKAAKLIDENLDRLKEKFILPSLGDKQGRIIKLMDKEYQVQFAKHYDLPIARTWVAKKDDWESITAEVKFPCIVKPVSSYEGFKSDIRKCDDVPALRDCLRVIFLEKNYSRILIQEWITFDYEIEFVGSFSKDDNSYLISRTYRGWPVVGGTNSYFGIIDAPQINATVDMILTTFAEEHFSGLFDIEMFNVNGKIYLNEINWRNTGNSFFCLGTNVHYAVIWYYSVIGHKKTNLKHYCTDCSQYAMNEATDSRYVVFNHYPFLKWNSDRSRTQSYALWYRYDLKPVVKRYIQLFRKLVFR